MCQSPRICNIPQLRINTFTQMIVYGTLGNRGHHIARKSVDLTARAIGIALELSKEKKKPTGHVQDIPQRSRIASAPILV